MKLSNKEARMHTYLVDRHIPGITLEQLSAAQEDVLEASRLSSVRGKPVRYFKCVFIPAESHTICLFEAANAKEVQEVNEAAQFPFTRIIEVVDIEPGH
jgi:hypothetical protein